MNSVASESRSSNQSSIFGLFGFILLATSLLVMLAWFTGGRTLAEKVATELASPLGFAWMLIGVVAVITFWQRNLMIALTCLVAWLLMTLFGNDWVANRLSQQLESDYQAIDPFQIKPLDTLVVLGGGTNSRLSGAPQLAYSGDRVGLAAQLYHAGLADQIICSGSNTFKPFPEALNCNMEAQQILIRLGVPVDKIVLIEGENTSQELANLASFLGEKNHMAGKIGLLTSAWHLPRAMRLAEKNQLTLLPVPANFRSEPDRINPNWIVPGSEQLNTSRSVLKEYLGLIVGR